MRLNSLYKIYLLSKMFFCQNSSHSCWKDYIWLPALDFQRFKSIQSSFPALPHCLICAFVLSSQVLQLLQSSHSQLFESWESQSFHSHFFNKSGSFLHSDYFILYDHFPEQKWQTIIDKYPVRQWRNNYVSDFVVKIEYWNLFDELSISPLELEGILR